jgi:hypothetical protein
VLSIICFGLLAAILTGVTFFWVVFLIIGGAALVVSAVVVPAAVIILPATGLITLPLGFIVGGAGATVAYLHARNKKSATTNKGRQRSGSANSSLRMSTMLGLGEEMEGGVDAGTGAGAPAREGADRVWAGAEGVEIEAGGWRPRTTALSASIATLATPAPAYFVARGAETHEDAATEGADNNRGEAAIPASTASITADPKGGANTAGEGRVGPMSM